MPTTPKRPLALALLAAAALPVAAPLATAQAATSGYRLGGSPQIRDVHGGVGTLRFAANRLPTRGGEVDVSITMYGGKRVGTVRVDGTHGTDLTYAARVSGGVRAGGKYTVRFRLAGGHAFTETVKAYDH